jgi:hypothetical protein
VQVTEEHINRVLASPRGSTLEDVRQNLLAEGLTDGDIFLVCQAAEMLRPGILDELRNGT